MVEKADSGHENQRVVPYERPLKMIDQPMTDIDHDQHTAEKEDGSRKKTTRLASTIVTSSRVSNAQEENVTIRSKDANRFLSF